MGFEVVMPSFFGTFGTTRVVIEPGGRGPDSREPVPLDAHVQSKRAFFAVDAPVFEGDVLEVSDPRGGVARFEITAVDVHNYGPAHLRHLEAHIAPIVRRGARPR